MNADLLVTSMLYQSQVLPKKLTIAPVITVMNEKYRC